MIRIPFSRELDDLFQQDRRIWLKVVGGGFAGALVALTAIGRMPDKDRSPIVLASLITVFTLGGVSAVLALSLKDIVRRRLTEGKPVNTILRAYFAHGVGSLLLWFITVVFGTLIITISILSI